MFENALPRSIEFRSRVSPPCFLHSASVFACGPPDTSSRALSKRTERGPCDRLQTRDQFNQTSAEQKNFRRGTCWRNIFTGLSSARASANARAKRGKYKYTYALRAQDAGNRCDFRIRHGDSNPSRLMHLSRDSPRSSRISRVIAPRVTRVSKRTIEEKTFGKAPETN